MATQENKSTGAAQQAQQGFVYLPLIAGWLVPGAGHFLLRKWGRGALLAASILGMFTLGLAMQGKIYSSAHEMLEFLGLHRRPGQRAALFREPRPGSGRRIRCR